MDNYQLMELVERVTEALLRDPRTRNSVIEVANDRGIVTLKGSVEKEAISQAAEEITREQEGVITVINEIKVS
ncbi:MAG: BON domain-containing protein [Chloroflexi bacterium]|nr:BON domain-containing protein [Chloroflexota bacterium]